MHKAGHNGEVIEQARNLAREAFSVSRGSDPAYPLALCDRALALLAPLGPSDTLADVLRWKGNILRDCGDHARALDLFAQSLAIADATFYTIGRALAKGRVDEAHVAVKRALEIASQRRDTTRQASALCQLGRITRRCDPKSPEVMALLNRALELSQTGEDVEIRTEIPARDRELVRRCWRSGQSNLVPQCRAAHGSHACQGVAARTIVW